eukprot:TRINITY_DN12313_c0_g1_i1.p1 TRINITY_DN12313_c0_g1~~TRINITY_DN12313_c0_g1_i1.p1  ORF type:complete len:442 (-),score=87.34 TRINITY_DN12313_c0_g1_i1:49-1374(-)
MFNRSITNMLDVSHLKNQDRAEIVIIGGGCIGLGVAYALAQAGKKDVIVLEREEALSSVTSAAAAGLVGQVRDNLERVLLAMWSVKTFEELQKNETFNPSWRPVGSLRVANTLQRVEEFKKMKKVCDEAGLPVHLISPSEAESKWPGMKFTNNCESILWCPSDGYLQPSDLTNSYYYHASAKGHRFYTKSEVVEITTKPVPGHIARVTGVKLKGGEFIHCDNVINAAGAHAYHIAKLVGLEVPIFPVRHEYFITEPVQNPEIKPTFPVMRIPDKTLYLRPDVNSLLCGGWEPNGKSLDPKSVRLDERMPGIQDDWPVLHEFAEQLSAHYPKVNDVGIRAVMSGWPTFVPDGKFVLGPTEKVKGFVMAAGCNAHGVSGSAGIGRHVVASMFGGKDMSEAEKKYMFSLRPDRFQEETWLLPHRWEEAQNQARAVYETYYCIKH